MLDPWIIEEIRRKEREERQREDRPGLEMPVMPSRPPEVGNRSGEQNSDRGIAILDFSI